MLETAIRDFHGGRLDRAGDQCERALKLDRRNPTALHLLGVISHQTGQPDRAANLIAKSLKIEPKNPDAQNHLGVILAETGRLDEAAKRFQRAVSLKPEFAEGQNNLGNALKQLGQSSEAVAAFSAAVRLRPDYAEAYNGLGTALRDVGRLDDAEAAIRKAIELRGDHPAACLNLGNVLTDKACHKEAAEFYHKALAADAALSEAFEYLTGAYQSLGDPVLALETARQWVSAEPESPRALWVLAGALASAEAFDEALATYEQAQSLTDDPVLQAKILFEVSQLPGRAPDPVHLQTLEDISAKTDELNAVDPDVDIRSQIAFGRAAMLDKLGRVDEAWAEFSAANARLDASLGEVWRGEVSTRRNALEDAKRWTQSTNGDAETPDALPVSLFILGASRSGKSTVEKVAGSLENVTRAYESLLVLELAAAASEAEVQPGSARLSALDVGARTRFTQTYREAVQDAAGSQMVVTNTHPHYIFEAGQIVELVPKARFVFVERDREDTALRIFMKLYNAGTNAYAYDLGKIYDYLDWTGAMFDAWEAKLGDRVLRLRYEEVVSEPDVARQKLAALCGIPGQGAENPALGDDRGAAAPYAQFLAAAKQTDCS